jgi:hypothetical protein
MNNGSKFPVNAQSNEKSILFRRLIMTDHTSSNIRIAFVDISIFEDGSVRGGALITDTFSRPYEFRVTSPIKPTQLQIILYGKSLVEYMYGELICLPLLKQVEESVSLAVCRDEHLLVARPDLHFPLIVIKKPGQGSDKEGIGATTIRVHKNFRGEQSQAEVLLSAMSQQFDIFEPFERIKLAVSEVHKQKIN